MGPLRIDGAKVFWHRLRVNHLGERLPAQSFEEAAFAGLQDSAPRAAIAGLHARVKDVRPEDWEHPSLVQTWAPRGAVFVVPRRDLPVFALGISPRDPDVRSALGPLVEAARRSVSEVRPEGDEATLLGPIPAAVARHLRRQPVRRLVFALAGVQVRWDARNTSLLPSPPPEMEEEEARRELARRFLRSLGPATPASFSRWAAVSGADAQATFEALGRELVEVEWPSGAGLLLADDVERLVAAQPVVGVRLIPFGGDPVLQPGNEIVSSDDAHRRAAFPPWACTGLVLKDGQVVAAWGRSAGRVTLFPLGALHESVRMEIEEEAVTTPFVTATAAVWR